MSQFIVPNRRQQLLFTQIDLESIAPLGSALRTIDALVDKFDTSAIEAEYDLESEQGREPLHPKTLIKVALSALHNCRFSLRKMEYDTGAHLGYRWLTGDEGIDHSTMGKFLDKYKEQIIFITHVQVMTATPTRRRF
jgi:transposase